MPTTKDFYKQDHEHVKQQPSWEVSKDPNFAKLWMALQQLVKFGF